jgi:hypothetical protein
VEVRKQTGSLTLPATYPSAPTFRLPVDTELRLPTVVNLAGGATNNPTPPSEWPIGTKVYVVEDGIASNHTNSGGLTAISTSSANYIKVSLTKRGPPITFAASQPLGCSYVIESPQWVPPGEYVNGWGGAGPDAYGNLVQLGTLMARWAGFTGAQAVNDNIASVVVSYTDALAANPKKNNPKLAMKFPLAA